MPPPPDAQVTDFHETASFDEYTSKTWTCRCSLQLSSTFLLLREGGKEMSTMRVGRFIYGANLKTQILHPTRADPRNAHHNGQSASLVIRPCRECTGCVCFGICEFAELPLITDEMLSNPAWLRDARNFGSSLAIDAALWPNEVFNLARDAKVKVPDDFPSVELFLPPDDADGEEIKRFTEALRSWFRAFFPTKPIPEDQAVFVTEDRREHARVVLTLLASNYADDFKTWGRR